MIIYIFFWIKPRSINLMYLFLILFKKISTTLQHYMKVYWKLFQTKYKNSLNIIIKRLFYHYKEKIYKYFWIINSKK